MPFSQGQRIALACLPRLAAALLRLLGSTLRFTETRDPGAHPADADAEGDVYVFWHRVLLLAAYRYRDLGAAILISSSFDGELIARTAARLGYIPVRGSSSRGGAAGLLQLTRLRSAGTKISITADGPRGPVGIVKEGAAAVALHTGSTVSCVHLAPQNAWTLNSWDRFLIPRPFSKVHIHWSTATELIGTTTEATAQLQTLLSATTTAAEQLAAATSP